MHSILSSSNLSGWGLDTFQAAIHDFLYILLIFCHSLCKCSTKQILCRIPEFWKSLSATGFDLMKIQTKSRISDFSDIVTQVLTVKQWLWMTMTLCRWFCQKIQVLLSFVRNLLSPELPPMSLSNINHLSWPTMICL